MTNNGAALVGRFHLSSVERQQMEREQGLSTIDLLRWLVGEVQALARVPVSDFRVGAAGLNSEGEIFLGVNLEFSGASFAQTVHAEQFLVSLSRTHSASPLVKLAVSAPPCGHCRQFVTEFDPQGDLELFIGEEDSVRMRELLPRAFGPGDLNVKEPFYSEPLSLADNQDLESAARMSARLSYVPYSKTRAGTAVKGACGNIFAGSALENAAYNPALPPLQAALVSAFASGCSPEDVREVILCQEKGGLIDYAPQLKDLANSLGTEPVSFRTVFL